MRWTAGVLAAVGVAVYLTQVAGEGLGVGGAAAFSKNAFSKNAFSKNAESAP